MPNFHIRISRPYDCIAEWINSEPCTKLAVYEHEADDEVSRVHCHIWATGIGKSDTLKNHLRKYIGSVEKTDWYFTEKNKKKEEWNDELITYMSKGVLELKLVKGYSETEINEFRNKWVDRKKEKIESKLFAEDGKLILEKIIPEKTKKMTKRQLIEKMVARYTPDMDTDEIIKIIRKILIENDEVIGMYKIIDYYDSLLMYANKEKFVDMVVAKINSRTRV